MVLYYRRATNGLGHNVLGNSTLILLLPCELLTLRNKFFVKHTIARSRQTPYSRGLYEKLFHDLATTYPKLWSRSGPFSTVIPRNHVQRWQWWLIQRWMSKRVARDPSSVEYDQFDGLSTWSRIKRLLTRRWTAEIATEILTNDTAKDNVEAGKADHIVEAIEDVNKILHIPNQNPKRHSDPGRLAVPYELNQRVSVDISVHSAPSLSENRPGTSGSSGGRNSGVIVEEHRPGDFMKDK